MTLRAHLNSGSEGQTLSPHSMTAALTAVKVELQELEQESVAFNPSSLCKQSGTPIGAASTDGRPIDSTMGQTEPDQFLNEPNTAPCPTAICASSSHFNSIGPETNIDENTCEVTDTSTGEGRHVRGDIDLVRHEEAAIEVAIAGPSSSPRRATGNLPYVKMENPDENYMLHHQLPLQLTVDHLDLIYHIESPVIFCRLCVYVCVSLLLSKACSRTIVAIYSIHQDKTSSSDIRVSFPINTPRRKLFYHCETEHPVEARKLALMGPEKLAQIRARIPRSAG